MFGPTAVDFFNLLVYMELNMPKQRSRPKFSVGGVVMIPSIQAILSQIDLVPLLQRHMIGDWGDCTVEDAAANDTALRTGGKQLSIYKTPASPEGEIWIMTEADRMVTTFLLPNEK